MNWDECLQHAEVSDIGMRRTTNQDAYSVVLATDMASWQQYGHLFVVADGMGAHAAGELASEMAVTGISHRYHKYQGMSAPEALHKAIVETNAEVHQRGQANLDFHNMGTTTSVLVLLPQGAMVAHVGDSRVYRLRGDQLDQLTFDHSLVWELRASGHLTEGSELARTVPKNIITRSLGPNAAVHTDFEGPFPIELGDTFLLCSDGLSGPVKDEEMGPILATLPPREAAQLLADLANLRGGPDNVTALVVKVTGPTMTTRMATSEPLMVQREKGYGAVHPFVFIATGVCFLAAIAMLVVQQRVPAAVALGGGIVSLVVAALQRWVFTPQGVALGNTRRLGKGPYVSIKCPVNAGFIEKLTVMVQQLREATQGSDWKLDIDQFNQFCQVAEQSARSRDYKAALTSYANAISHMMKELRQQGHHHKHK